MREGVSVYAISIDMQEARQVFIANANGRAREIAEEIKKQNGITKCFTDRNLGFVLTYATFYDREKAFPKVQKEFKTAELTRIIYDPAAFRAARP